ncbi:unnamed protein product [Penicillium camemberti]|uniref:Str. FM013 n=1 Tax=Penicillium camemberti (strain FM 013) TaxID=1429867 RepID=A0A0G4PW13_PENC3|nr:unnamed protein product [Penicillium camemberti]
MHWEWPRRDGTSVSVLHKAMAFTTFLASSLQTTQDALGEEGTGLGPIAGAHIRLRGLLHGSLRAPKGIRLFMNIHE